MALSKALGMDLPALAEMLRAKGRGKDSVLAHITPREAALLKKRGGSGTINPDTGLPEFDDGFDFGGPTYQELGYTPSSEQAAAPVATPEQMQAGGYNIPSASQPSAAPQAPVASYDPMQAGQEGFSYSGSPGQQISPTQTAYTPDRQGMSGADILAFQQGNYPVTPTKTDPNAPKDFSEQLKAALTPGNLARLGLVAGLGAFGSGQARKAGAQNVAATGEQQAIAAPYQQQGQQLIGQAQRGELSPQSQQAYQAAQAQINQGVANRGGVGQQQSANQLANIYNTLLNNQYTYGLQIAQIGDNISLGAIKTGLQLDQTLNQATTNFYTQLASLAAGGGIGGQTVTLRT